MKRCAVAVFLLSGLAVSGTAAAQSFERPDWMRGWRFGVGTGPFGLNTTGQFGYSTPSGSPEIRGTLKSSQFKNYFTSSYGFTAFATKDKWSVLWRYTHQKQTDTLPARLLTGDGASANLSLKADVAELDGVYNLGNYGAHQFGGLVGVRYTHQHQIAWLSGPGNNSRDAVGHWVDGVVGVTHEVPASPTITWHNRVDVGGGNDNYAYHLNSGLRWAFARNWAADFYGDFLKTDYERNNRGEAGWYLYRAKEFGVGAALSYTF